MKFINILAKTIRYKASLNINFSSTLCPIWLKFENLRSLVCFSLCNRSILISNRATSFCLYNHLNRTRLVLQGYCIFSSYRNKQCHLRIFEISWFISASKFVKIFIKVLEIEFWRKGQTHQYIHYLCWFDILIHVASLYPHRITPACLPKVYTYLTKICQYHI